MGRVRSNEAEQMMLGAWEWAADIGKTHSKAIRVALLPTARKGVWKVTVQAVESSLEQKPRVVAQYSREWPHSREQSLCALLFTMVCQLDKLLSNPPPIE